MSVNFLCRSRSAGDASASVHVRGAYAAGADADAAVAQTELQFVAAHAPDRGVAVDGATTSLFRAWPEPDVAALLPAPDSRQPGQPRITTEQLQRQPAALLTTDAAAPATTASAESLSVHADAGQTRR